LLTYGEYWNDMTTSPSTKVTMGNPNLAEYVPRSAAGNRQRKTKKVVLLISGGGNPEGLKRITLDLLRIMNPEEYEICFRPHPGEIPALRQRYDDLERKGVTFDLSTDLYSSLNDADVVAGEISTALFEAAYFGKTVLAMDHPYTRLHLDDDAFPLFEGAADLAGLIAQKRPQTSDPRLFWAEDWRQNYAAFIATAFARKGKQMDHFEPSRHVQTGFSGDVA